MGQTIAIIYTCTRTQKYKCTKYMYFDVLRCTCTLQFCNKFTFNGTCNEIVRHKKDLDIPVHVQDETYR